MLPDALDVMAMTPVAELVAVWDLLDRGVGEGGATFVVLYKTPRVMVLSSCSYFALQRGETGNLWHSWR